ncbi:MAG: helix-turn-helix transcriptional regulator [Pirellulales bacterium]|nr:helix-turn-helix transcriptional regulator [Pirellulales bacterium]
MIASSSLSQSDCGNVAALLGAVGDPLWQATLVERRSALYNGLGRLIAADAWVWMSGRLDDAAGGAGRVIAQLDDGWRSDVEREAMLRFLPHPVFSMRIPGLVAAAAAATGGANGYCDAQEELRPPFFIEQAWRKVGYDHALCSLVLLGEELFSGVQYHRRLGRPPFSRRDQDLVNIMFRQVTWLHRESSRPTGSEVLSRLTRRERQVLFLLLQGQARRQVALSLQLSEHTITDYIKRIYRKLEVTTRAALLAKFSHLRQHCAG